jgi:hypothetical protein
MQDRSDKRRSAREDKTMEAMAEIKHEGMDGTDRTSFVVGQTLSSELF